MWKSFITLSVNFNTGINLKSRGLHFFKVFYHLKIWGWSSSFRAIDDLPRELWNETEFSSADSDYDGKRIYAMSIFVKRVKM